MNIPAMPILKHQPLVLKYISAVLIFKAIVDFVMHKDNLLTGCDLFNMPTVIFTRTWREYFRSSMSYNLLLSGIVLGSCISIIVCYSTSMMPRLIMIALCIEREVSLN